MVGDHPIQPTLGLRPHGYFQAAPEASYVWNQPRLPIIHP